MALTSLRDQLLERLEALYAQMRRDASGAVNSCGTCRACCTADAMSHHRVSEIELALIAERVSAQASADFRAYLARERQEDGQLRFPVCPNYREGCGIYAVRPFSCRIFGHVKEEGTRLPDGCVFVGSEITFVGADYFGCVPESRPMRSLSREFQLFVRSPSTRFEQIQPADASEAPAPEFLNQGDALDRALTLQALGRPEEALAEILASPTDEGLYRKYSLALLYSSLERHTEARELFLELAEELPERAEFPYFAGYHALSLGLGEEAVAGMLATVRIDPQHSMAWGFLGYLAFQHRRFEEALEFFREARQADSSNPFFLLRWALCLIELGRNEEAQPALQQAALHPATAAQAIFASTPGDDCRKTHCSS